MIVRKSQSVRGEVEVLMLVMLRMGEPMGEVLLVEVVTKEGPMGEFLMEQRTAALKRVQASNNSSQQHPCTFIMFFTYICGTNSFVGPRLHFHVYPSYNDSPNHLYALKRSNTVSPMRL